MLGKYSQSTADLPPNGSFDIRKHRTVRSYERELAGHRRTEAGLRDALAKVTR
jgi:hypothetical protein